MNPQEKAAAATVNSPPSGPVTGQLEPRITIVSPTDYASFPFGGTLAFLQEFLGGLDKAQAARVRLVGISKGWHGDVPKVRIGEHEFEVNPLARMSRLAAVPLRGVFLMGLVRAWRLMKQNEGGVFYVHSPEAALLLRLICPHSPVIVHCHGSESTTRWSRFWYGRLRLTQTLYEWLVLRPSLRCSSRVFITADSQKTAEFIARRLSKHPEKVIRVPAMVSIALFRPGGGGQGCLRVVCVGRLDRVKGLELVLGAIREIAAEREDVELVVVGEGEARGYLVETARQAGIADRVRFLGYLDREDVAAELRKASVYVSGSHQEGFSLALLEAMAAGLPVVVTDVGGVAEIVQDGVNGYVCRSRDPSEMARKIMLAAAKALDMARASRATAVRFSSETVANQIIGELDAAWRGAARQGCS